MTTTETDRAAGHATMASTFATSPRGRWWVEVRHSSPAQAAG